MEDFLVDLFLSSGRINGAIVGAAFGAAGGLIGALIGTALSKVFKNEKLFTYAVIVFVVLSFQVPRLIKPYVEEAYAHKYQGRAVESVMQELERHRLFTVIFRYHPDAREALTKKMQDIVFNAPEDQVMMLSQAASAEIVSKYFQKHLPAASDEKTHALLNRNYEALKQFENKPELCVTYFLGQPNFTPEDVTPEFIQKESDMKADIIESAINSPSIPPRAGSAEEIFEIIILGYQDKGYPLENLEKLDYLTQIPASDACRVATEFSHVMASLDPKTSSFVFKNFMYLENEDN